MAANICLHLVILTIISSYTEALTFSVRLVNGVNNSSGRVEVFHAGKWGTVCSNNWGHNEAVVVCRMLGFSDRKTQSVGSAYFGAGSGPILNSVTCYGSEQSLDECSFNGWETHVCNHYRDAGVLCFSENHEFDIRLKGGSSLNVGRVEVYHSGVWGSVCDDNTWDHSEADVTCRILGYSAGHPIYRTTRYGSLTDPVWMTGVDCNGTEDSLADCSFDGWGQRGHCNSYPASVFCYNATETDFDIRLGGGTGPHVGRVEVYYSGVWGTVCTDNSWDYNDAIVTCRMLGYRTGQTIRQTSYYGRLIDPVWMRGVDCNGTEDSLADCPFDGWGQVGYCSRYPASAFCYNATETDFDIRLTGGSGAHVGRVEVYYSGYWGTVCGDNNLGYSDANVTCRMLGYSTGQLLYPTTRYGGLTYPVWMSGVDCNGTEDSLADCSFDGWGKRGHCNNYPASVFCYNVTGTGIEIRLRGGSGAHVGRVEVYYSGYWGTVCRDNNWDYSDVNVTCRMLGYSSGQQTYGPYSRTDHVWMKGLNCIGTEDSLADCPFDGWEHGGYCSSYDAGVFCYNVTEQNIDVRLSGGSGAHVGHVEVFYSGYWGSVCGYDNHWDGNDALVTCRMLGYSAGRDIYRTTIYGRLTDPVWMTGVDCNGTEDSLADCSFDGWGQGGHCNYYNYPASVFCYNVKVDTPIKVRLVDGPYNYTGRVEVYYSGYWGTICSQNYNFDDKDAAVVCKMLHYSNGRALSHVSGTPNEPIWMTNVRCNGTESSLADCPFDGWGNVGYCQYQPYITCFNVAGLLSKYIASAVMAGLSIIHG